MAPCPTCGQPRLCRTFRFDHEPSDSTHVTDVLRHLQALGVELGALVTLWYCPPCNHTEAEFQYSDE